MLRTIPTPMIAKISGNEPLHLFEASAAYWMSWYLVREAGVALCGPPPAEVIAPIARTEFEQASRSALPLLRTWLERPVRPGAEAYAVLSVCRALHSSMEHADVAKAHAASWAAAAFPRWESVIETALAWRERMHDPAPERAACAGTLAFIDFAIATLAR